jgi:hypothetical protein
MLNYAIELYTKAMTNEVLSGRHRQQPPAGQRSGAWIQNPISALRTIEHDTPTGPEDLHLEHLRGRAA